MWKLLKTFSILSSAILLQQISVDATVINSYQDGWPKYDADLNRNVLQCYYDYGPADLTCLNNKTQAVVTGCITSDKVGDISLYTLQCPPDTWFTSIKTVVPFDAEKVKAKLCGT